jgi:hypothetical protein
MWSITYDTANAKEPDDHVHNLHEVCSIRPDFTVYLDFPQELQADVEIEDGTNANRAKESYIQCLSFLLNLVYMLVHSVDNRWPAEHKDQNPKKDKADWGDNIIVEEVIPRTDSAVPDEYGDIEEHIERWLEGVILSLESKPITAKY